VHASASPAREGDPGDGESDEPDDLRRLHREPDLIAALPVELGARIVHAYGKHRFKVGRRRFAREVNDALCALLELGLIAVEGGAS
jgi:hypothetical protein